MSIDHDIEEFNRYAFSTTGLITLCIRYVQGWVFWAGGSRRFIYAPQKLDPHATYWLANKLQSAMPGSLLGMDQVINFLLHHFLLLYTSLVLFSLGELLCGLGLILGLFTRLCAFGTLFFSVMLMLIFGWEGSTCLDEWTMAVCNFAMAITLMLSGASVFSTDAWLLKRYPSLQHARWFSLLGSGPWPRLKLKRLALGCLIITLLFTLGSYDYFRGAIISRYHTGPVSSHVFNLRLSNGQIHPNEVSFTLDATAGNTAVPNYIMRIELMVDNKLMSVWTSNALSALPPQNIRNAYAYNRITTGPYGLIVPVSAKAQIILPNSQHNTGKLSQLRLYTIAGERWDLALSSH